MGIQAKKLEGEETEIGLTSAYPLGMAMKQ